jgi:DNA polymerase-3 subunit epsilon
MRYLILDTETGGLDPTKHSLLTAYFRITDENFQAIDSLSIKLKPEDGVYRVTKRALQVNKINLLTHDMDAIVPEEAYRRLTTFLNRHSKGGEEKLTPIGHNPTFDEAFIKTAILAHNKFGVTGDETWRMYVDYHRIDTASLVEILKLKGAMPKSVSSSLTSLATFFGIDNSGAHDAEIDVDITIDVLKAMLNYVVGPTGI